MLKNELQGIISGTRSVTNGTAIQAITDFIRKGQAAGINAEKDKFVKEQEAAAILTYANTNDFFVSDPHSSRYLAEGAEQKVYLNNDGLSVTKLNDSIFYETWTDYFNSLLLHNFFFPATSYELIGFVIRENQLLAAVKQSFIRSTSATDIDKVKELMASNGFVNNRNNDYINTRLGIIAEDLHDENVLNNYGVLFFIDTVFFLMPTFYY